MKYSNSIIPFLMLFAGSLAFAQDGSVPPATAGSTMKEVAVEKMVPPVSSDAAMEMPAKEVAPDPQAYHIGIDDILEIDIIRPVPINTRMKVTSDGAVTFPYIGIVHVSGQTLSQVQTKIQNQLSDGGYMDYPVVSVSLWYAGSKKFTIYGEVVHPGDYPVKDNLLPLRAISMAGGLSVPDSIGEVRVLRPNKDGRGKSVIFESDITDLLNGKQDVVIQSGDTLIVNIDKFFVYGEVLHPGSYAVEENMSVADAITIAGGFAFTAVGGYIESGPMGRVKLHRARPRNNEAPVFESDINSVLGPGKRRIIVHAGDTIVVSLDKFFLTGQVNRPGAYPVEDHMSLLNAISTAGGFTPDTSTGSIKLLRPQADGSVQQFDTDVTSVLNGTAPAITIRPMDTIVITANIFYVFGEVNKPGMYSLESRTNALTAISIAGGFSRFGSASRVKVIRMDDKTGRYETIKVSITEAMAGNPQADVLLMPNDVVVVSEGVF